MTLPLSPTLLLISRLFRIQTLSFSSSSLLFTALLQLPLHLLVLTQIRYKCNYLSASPYLAVPSASFVTLRIRFYLLSLSASLTRQLFVNSNILRSIDRPKLVVCRIFLRHLVKERKRGEGGTQGLGSSLFPLANQNYFQTKFSCIK